MSTTTEKPQKLSIGFHGGQVLAARVQSAELTRFRESLGANAPGWFELAAEDGDILIDPTHIDYVLVVHDDHRVGF